VNVLKSNQRATIETLLERNTSQHEIARITGIDRKTVRSYHQRWLEQLRSNSPGVATSSAQQIPPTLATGSCAGGHLPVRTLERVHRSPTAPEAQRYGHLRGPGRPAQLCWPVQLGQSFCATLRHKETEQFDRLSFLLGEEMQVDYGEGALTRVPGSDR